MAHGLFCPSTTLAIMAAGALLPTASAADSEEKWGDSTEADNRFIVGNWRQGSVDEPPHIEDTLSTLRRSLGAKYRALKESTNEGSGEDSGDSVSVGECDGEGEECGEGSGVVDDDADDIIEASTKGPVQVGHTPRPNFTLPPMQMQLNAEYHKLEIPGMLLNSMLTSLFVWSKLVGEL